MTSAVGANQTHFIYHQTVELIPAVEVKHDPADLRCAEFLWTDYGDASIEHETDARCVPLTIEQSDRRFFRTKILQDLWKKPRVRQSASR